MDCPFIDFLSNYIKLSQEEIHVISNHINVQTFKKGAIILSEGEITDKSYFIIKGCVSSYYLVEGEVKVTEFFIEKQPIIPTSNTTKKPSEYYLECLEDCAIAIATPESTKELLSKAPRLAPLGSRMLEDQLTNQRSKYDDLFKLSPYERYQNLQKTSPDLLNRVPQYLIASYLGIKPESLSRIRKRINKN
jgi:CRP-like cAMP-binding protein